jgi:hypothetical protein
MKKQIISWVLLMAFAAVPATATSFHAGEKDSKTSCTDKRSNTIDRSQTWAFRQSSTQDRQSRPKYGVNRIDERGTWLNGQDGWTANRTNERRYESTPSLQSDATQGEKSFWAKDKVARVGERRQYRDEPRRLTSRGDGQSIARTRERASSVEGKAANDRLAQTSSRPPASLDVRYDVMEEKEGQVYRATQRG